MWQQLSSAIAGGVTFATVLTLFLTPCILMLKENFSAKRRKRTVVVDKDFEMTKAEIS
jgi:multidrug efflux pump